MAKELMIIFVYDTECCLLERDDPADAVLYFYPSWVSEAQKLSLCGQLMGTTQFLRQSFGNPKLISLQSGKFVLKKFGRFYLVVGTDRNISESLLNHRADLLNSLLQLYHCDVEIMHKQILILGQYKNLSEKLYSFFETYLPIVQCNGNILQNMPIARLPKSVSNIYLEAMHTLQSCQLNCGVLGGTIFYHNKVIATQLSSGLTKNLALTDPHRIKTTGQVITVNYHVPVGIQLIIIYITNKEYRKLSEESLRAQNATTQSVNHSVAPFQFKKKIKRDKSIIFTNIPEEGTTETVAEISTSNLVTARPNHLPLRFKNVTTRDYPESGFNSINFDETDSFPQFIGRTSVCSTPMTENKVLHGTVLPLFVNETDTNDSLDEKSPAPIKPSPTKQLPVSNKEDYQNLWNYHENENIVDNPFRERNRHNSLLDFQASLRRISKRLSVRPFGIGLTMSNFKSTLDVNETEIEDFSKHIYRTIADPTYPVFNSDGAPISKYLFQEYLDRQEKAKNDAISNAGEIEIGEDCLIEGFDTDIQSNGESIEMEKITPTDTLVHLVGGKMEQMPDKRRLSLPLKDLNTNQLSKKIDRSGHSIGNLSSIFESNQRKLSGIQLTPLMNKLTVLALNDERSSGFTSYSTTPGIEIATPLDGKPIVAQQRISNDKTVSVDECDNDLQLRRVELFICGQQNMTMYLLMDENESKKQELVQRLFDVCLLRLSKIESNLDQTINIHVDPIKGDGEYSFISLDPNWDTLQRSGPWCASELNSIERIKNDFKTQFNMTDITLRTKESVIYGYRYGESGIFYKQASNVLSGIPPPADCMGTISLNAKRRLDRDHSVILL